MRHPRLLTLAALLFLVAGTPAHGQDAKAPAEDPRQGLLPKGALGADAFLRAHPEWDGRGVLVAVIDSGVDLGHPGLQRTSDGKPKIVDCFDATDGGDIDTRVVGRIQSGTLVGLTGRALRPPAKGSADGTYRLGVVRSARHLPEDLHARLLRQRKLVREEAHRRADAVPAAEADATAKARAEDRREAENADDPGPAFDCVVWRRDGSWWVAIDTDGDGDLGNETALRPFRETRDVGRFPEAVHLAYAVEVCDEGARVVLHCDGGGHGTHVAGIIGAFYGADDPLNGLAPGCQILSIRCGNPRFGGPTTHLAMAKGIDWACRRGARVINISFGGDSFFRHGREVSARFVDDATRRYGVPIVLSAGNEGPALATIGSPATAFRAYAIGAWAPAGTQESNYGVPAPVGGRLFDFSSRGPMATGDVGVDFLAPGAAVSPLPTWHLQRQENWNGTSMAAPQATGAIALVVSAALAEKLPLGEARLRRALEASARPVPGLSALEQGAGLLQVGPAVEALRRLAAGPEPVRYVVRTAEGGPAAGLCERDFRETQPVRRAVLLAPDLPDFRETGANAARAAFARNLALAADVPWISVARVCQVTAAGTWVPLTILPEKLGPGLNFGRVLASEEGDTPDAPPRFTIPVTLVRPEVVAGPDYVWRGAWDVGPGDRRAAFLAVPEAATRVRLRLREALAARNRYTVALKAPSGWRGSFPAEVERMWLARGEEWTGTYPVEGGTVLEIAAFARWQECAPGRLEVEATFHGVSSPDAAVVVPPGRSMAHWRLRSGLREVSAEVGGSVTHAVEPLDLAWTVGADARVATVLDGEPMGVGVGTATLACPDGKARKVEMRVDPACADFLDDATWEALDANGRLVGRGHFWSGSFDFTPPHAGTFRLVFTLPERGHTRLDAGGWLAPVALREIDAQAVTILPDLDGELPEAADAPDAYRLARGESRSLFLRLPALDAGLYRGVLTCRDTDRGVDFGETVLEVDTRPAAPGPEAARERFAAEIRSAVQDRLAAWALDAEGQAEVEQWIGAAAAAGIPEAEVTEWSVALALAKGDAASLALANKQLIEPDGDAAHDPEVRAALVRHHLAVAELRCRGAGDPAGVAAALDAALRLDPEPPGHLRVRLRFELGEGRDLDALGTAKTLRKDRPADHALARVVLDCYRRLGWLDRVRDECETWTDRFPAATDEVLDLGRELLGSVAPPATATPTRAATPARPPGAQAPGR